jgi:cell division protein FtsL
VSVAAPAPRTAAPRRSARSAAPARKPRPVERGRRGLLSGAVLWVVLLAALFGGIVALNVAALRGTIDANRVESEAESLKEQNTALASEVAAMSGYGRIAVKASKLGMVPAQPARSDYIPFIRQAAHPARARPARNAHPPGKGQAGRP